MTTPDREEEAITEAVSRPILSDKARALLASIDAPRFKPPAGSCRFYVDPAPSSDPPA